VTRFLAGFGYALGGNYTAILLSFVTNVLLTRALGAAELGRLALLVMVSNVLAFAVSNWTLTAFVHFGARQFAAEGTIGRAFWTRTAVLAPALAVALVGVGVIRPGLARYLVVPEPVVPLLVLHFLATAALNTAGAALQATARLRRYGAALALDKALALAAVLAVLTVGALDAVTALACSMVAALAVSTWVFVSLGPVVFRPALVSPTDWLTMGRYSVPLIASTWAGLFGTQWIDYVVIKRYLPLREVGLYALAYQLAGVVQQASVVLSTLMIPRFSAMIGQDRGGDLKRVVDRAVPYWLFGLSAGLAVLLGGIDVLVPLVFGPAFAGAVAPLALLIVATLALALFNTFTPLLAAHGATWSLSGVCLLSAAANVVLNLALIPRFGIVGAAWATVIAYAISATLVLAIVQRRFELAAGRCLLFVAPVGVVYLCSVLFRSTLFYPIGAAALAVTALTLVRAFRLFEPSDLPLIGEDWPPWVRTRLVKMFSLRGGVA
jgi:O-antigen/teichoic acid export membrane protein